MATRKVVHIDPTGKTLATRTTHYTPKDDQTLADRLAALRAGAMEYATDPVSEAAHVRCDGCGATTAMDPTRLALPEDWQTTGQGDFCPDCHAGRPIN